MKLLNNHQTYGSVSKFLHWLIFLSILFMIILGFVMGDTPKSIRGDVYNLHKITGLTILGLMLLRLIWALINRKPKLPEITSFWERCLSRCVQVGLYIAVIAMPLSGWLMSTAANKLPHLFGVKFAMPGVEINKALVNTTSNVHETLAWVIIVLAVLHILGALKHHFIDKDTVLKTMLPGRWNQQGKIRKVKLAR